MTTYGQTGKVESKLIPLKPVRRSSAAPLLLGGFVLLALVVVISVLFASRERTINLRAQAALVAQDRLENLFSTVRQAENGSRGYLIAGDQISMTTYDTAVSEVPRDLRLVDEALKHDPDGRELPAVHGLVGDKLGQLAQTMDLLRKGDKQAAAGLIKADLDRLTMVDLRNLAVGIGADEGAHVAAYEAEEMRDGWLLELATAVAVWGILMLAWFAIRTNIAQTNHLRAAEAALMAANEVLEQKVEDRTATLNASEARFRLLSETLPALVYMSDPTGEQMLYVNPQFCAYFGMKAEAMLEFGWSNCVHPDDLARCVGLWKASTSGARQFEREYRLRRHDGAYRWFLDRTMALQNADGVITAWIGSATDIHDHKLAEAGLENANAALEQRVAERSAELDRIFTLSTDILTIGGFDGQLISVSPAWEQITGRPVEEALTQPYTVFLHPDDIVETEAAVARLRLGQTVAMQNRILRKDGSWCWLSWRAVPQPESQLIYSVARDITAEREREEQLRQSQKMEVVGQLTGGVAHDFNNLLTIIIGSLELLQRGLGENATPKLIRRVEAASEATRRAAALTHRLLAFSRRQPLAPKALDVNRLLAGMTDMLHRTLGEMINVEVVSAAGLWQALADANQLENAILNLAVNARDAMLGGGHLSIETQNAYLDDAYSAQNAEVPPGQYVLVAVTDTGIGMSAEVRAKVFEPFFTTKKQGEGTGLGLAQVYGFIKQSGGHVSVYSEPGEGTSVKLYLPRARVGSGAPEPMPAAVQGEGNGETVLVVEDEAGVRGFSAEVLTELGYNVLTAGNAAEALEIFETVPGVRMLFTDVVLGSGMNGRQLADEILRRNPGIIVLFTTGYTRNAIIHHGRLDDGIHFLGKPFTATALGEKVFTLFENAKVKAD